MADNSADVGGPSPPPPGTHSRRPSVIQRKSAVDDLRKNFKEAANAHGDEVSFEIFDCQYSQSPVKKADHENDDDEDTSVFQNEGKKRSFKDRITDQKNQK